MAKQPNIRWRNQDLKALERYVRNFNAKVSRLQKKFPSNVELYPTKLSIKDVKSKITSRQDFNREVKKIQRFSRRGSETIKETPTGLKRTAYELKEVSIMQRVINAKRKKELERLGLKPERGLASQVEKQNLAPKKSVLKVKPQDYEKYVESLVKEIDTGFMDKRMSQYRENYIRGLRESLGKSAGIIEQLLDQVPDDVLVDNSLGNPFLTIEFQYMDTYSIQERADKIYEEWVNALR